MNKKGLAPLIITIIVALIVGAGAVGYEVARIRSRKVAVTTSTTSRIAPPIINQTTNAVPVSCQAISSLKLLERNPKYPYQVNFVQLKLKGNYAYVLDQYDYGLHIIDIRNPFSPKVVGKLKVNRKLKIDQEGHRIGNDWSSQNIYILNNNYVYITFDSRFKLIDVSDKTNPKEISTYDSGVPNVDVFAIDKNYAYVTSAGEGYGGKPPGFYIFDVSNSRKPKKIGKFFKEYYIDNIYALNNHVYLTTQNGLVILDVSNPYSPVKIGSINLKGLHSIYVKNNYAYGTGSVGADSKGTLYIIDISDPSHPKLIQSLEDTAYHLINQDVNNLYLGETLKNGNRIIDTIDISKAPAVKLLQKYQLPPANYAAGYDIVDRYVYSNKIDGLEIFKCK